MATINPRLADTLRETARRIRLKPVEVCYRVGPERRAHPGPALSIVDILVALYEVVLSVDPRNPHWPDRDRLVLSKGHACVALYAVLAHKGFFSEKELYTLRQPGSLLQGHPCMQRTPGVDMTTGSLGNGLSAGVGMAIGARLDRKDCHVFVLLGDGETDEGSVWEAAQSAAKYELGNLTAIVDCNGYQSCGACAQIMPPGDMEAKWRSFGWSVEQVDGHDMGQLVAALSQAKTRATGGPRAIIARTVKGKGVSFMENDNSWHQRALTEAEWNRAREELGGGA